MHQTSSAQAPRARAAAPLKPVQQYPSHQCQNSSIPSPHGRFTSPTTREPLAPPSQLLVACPPELEQHCQQAAAGLVSSAENSRSGQSLGKQVCGSWVWTIFPQTPTGVTHFLQSSPCIRPNLETPPHHKGLRVHRGWQMTLVYPENVAEWHQM